MCQRPSGNSYKHNNLLLCILGKEQNWTYARTKRRMVSTDFVDQKPSSQIKYARIVFIHLTGILRLTPSTASEEANIKIR